MFFSLFVFMLRGCAWQVAGRRTVPVELVRLCDRVVPAVAACLRLFLTPAVCRGGPGWHSLWPPQGRSYMADDWKHELMSLVKNPPG